jgi:peroxiredoxin
MLPAILLLSAQQSGVLSLEDTGAVTARLGYMPVQIQLSDKKPSKVTKEPTYRATPQYAIIKVGNGPKSDHVIALDEPKDQDWKIYIDFNNNGNLTDDGTGAWNTKRDGDRPMYGVLPVNFRASYGTATKETGFANCTIGFYRFVREGANPLLCYRQSARTGEVAIDGVKHKVRLVENDGDALYNKPVAKVEDAGKTRPVWLQIDTKDDGTYASGSIDARAPFQLGEKVYEAKISDDGSKLEIKPTKKPVLELTPKRPESKPLLKEGTQAPDFVAEKWGGGNLKLSDYRGQVVILDFWATWCGPCQKSMPHVEQVYKAVKDQGVAVLAVCVWDDKKPYEAWIPANKDKYTFQFAFDPAGRDSSKSIAGTKFNVSGIPTTYIIDKEGKVAAAIVGYDDNDKRVEEALKKLGLSVNL